MKKSLTCFISCCLAIGIFFSANLAMSAAKITLNIASLEPVGAPSTIAVQHFASLLAERSKGEIQINPNPAGSLGTGLQIMEGVSTGTIDMVSMVLEWYAPFVKDINVYAMGFTFRDTDHFKAFLNSPSLRRHERTGSAKDESQNPRNELDQFTPGLWFPKNPSPAPRDIANIKMRVPEIETYLKVWKGLGYQPYPSRMGRSVSCVEDRNRGCC